MAIVSSSRGFGPVLSNRHFRKLWAAQWLAQTSQNTTNFILIVLIERLTGSSVNQGIMILSFTLPAVFLAPISGVIIDRWPKRYVLVASNALRVVCVLLYMALLWFFPGHSNAWLLIGLYAIAFVMASVGQFFNPAEAASIPLLVDRPHLMAANSLFNLTLALSQVVGLIILGPLAVKLIGIERAFVLVGIMYAAAAILVSRLPKDHPAQATETPHSSWERVKIELRQGAAFVVRWPPVLVTMTYLTLIASLVMVLAMLAPGIASRVLHLAPEDAMVVFAPAGIGMLLAAIVLGRNSDRVPKRKVAQLGLVAMVVGFAVFGVLAWRLQATSQPLALDARVMSLPPVNVALVVISVILSLLLGLSASSVNIVSQTMLQEYTPDELRGRVFAVQFMLNNLVGIPPMLAIGVLADLAGIPQVLIGVSLMILLVLVVTNQINRRAARHGLQIMTPFPASVGFSFDSPHAVDEPAVVMPTAIVNDVPITQH